MTETRSGFVARPPLAESERSSPCFSRGAARRLVATLLLAALAGCQEAGERPPNVVLIIADDQAWTDYGFQGHPVVETPRIDAFAEQSAVFPRGYVTTSLCRPSLATLITGLYAHQHGITGNEVAPPPDRPADWVRHEDPDYLARCERLIARIEQVPTLPQLLARRGYVSHQSGKWWEGHHARGGFTAGMTHGRPHKDGRHGDKGLEIGREGMAPVLDFIDAAGDEPFFVWYAPLLPHTPHDPPERLLQKYKAPGRPVRLARYYAMCEWFDETCGKLLDHLDARGLREDTLVVLLADNGWVQRTPDTPVPPGWERDYLPRSKDSSYEAGIRTPILLRWPGHIEPGVFPTLVSSLDIAPTILAACGLAPTREMQGIDLLEVCAGREPVRDAVFGELFAQEVVDVDDPLASLGSRWCRTGRWKLILPAQGAPGSAGATPVAGGPQLYDVLADPHEERDLGREEPERVAELTRRIDDWWSP